MKGFIIFLVAYFTIYGGSHLYAFVKLKKGISFNVWTGAILAVFMVVMVTAPIIVRISERYGYEHFARAMAYIGYIWMGLLFIYVSASFMFDVYGIILAAGRLVFRKYFISITPTAGFSCMISMMLACVIMLYGFYEALDIRLERYSISTDQLPEQVERLKIVQVSDIHLGIIVGEMRLRRILDRVREARPDILVSTGDLVDGQMDNLTAMAEMIQNIKTPLGKYAVTGNHEFYAGISRSLAFTEKAGFKALRGEGITVSDIINIAGVDDPARQAYGSSRHVSEKDLLSSLPEEKFTLLLKHQPIIDAEAVGLFDLQLSGHTHKGQIFPFSLVTRLFYKRHAGLSKIQENSFVYVSRGSGTWGPPARFLSPPEVTLIELVRKE